MDTRFRIKTILAAKGMTMKTLAEAVGISPQTLGASLRDGANPTVATLEKVAAALDVPVAALFTDYLRPSRSVVACPYCGGRIDVNTCDPR